MRATRPAGFVFLTGCALVCACWMATALAWSGASPARFALGATGALALVTAEALAFVRPWAYSASLALAGTFVAMLFVTLGDFAGGLVVTGVVAVPILIALSIVYNGHASLSAAAHNQPPARIRVP